MVRIPSDIALILDDYHSVDAKPIHDLMAFLLKNLPDEQIEVNPKLCIFYAKELFKSGDLVNAEKRLQAAEQILASTSMSDPEIECQ